VGSGTLGAEREIEDIFVSDHFRYQARKKEEASITDIRRGEGRGQLGAGRHER
jgi:hypothetical protein